MENMMYSFFEEYQTIASVLTILWSCSGIFLLIAWYFNLNIAKKFSESSDFITAAYMVLTAFATLIALPTYFMGTDKEIAIVHSAIYGGSAVCIAVFTVMYGICYLGVIRKKYITKDY